MYFLADFAKKKIDQRELSRNNLANNIIGDKKTMKKIRKESLDKFKSRQNLNTLIENKGEIAPELKPAPNDSAMIIKPRKEGLDDLKNWIRGKY